ncbi:cytochrome c1 [Marinicella sp. W31]|uniref:cytochrome c1 n=1 Tax=Marinicella sp. W31 TaxID=3023713 RepID=UPI00375636B6
MIKKISYVMLALLVAITSAQAAGGGPELKEKAHNNIRSKESLRSGAQTYMDFCFGCHSMAYQRYNRVAQDLELTEDEMMNNLVPPGAKFSDKMEISMDQEQAKQGEWFSKAKAPDLTVIAKARGVDWLFNYLLSFYADESRPTGWNNTVYTNSMPHVLWELQGIQKANFTTETGEDGLEHQVFQGFEMVQEGSLSPEEYKNLMRDLVNFLDYSSEPAKLIRLSYAPWVLAFLAFFTFMAYLLKLNYFRDIH